MGSTGGRAPRRRIWWGLALAVLAAGLAGGYARLDDPLGSIQRGLIAFGELQTSQGLVDNDEYLVFLKHDTPANRKLMMAASAKMTYLGESLFPGVVVVKIPDGVEQALDALRRQAFVRLVMKYNPAFGCH